MAILAGRIDPQMSLMLVQGHWPGDTAGPLFVLRTDDNLTDLEGVNVCCRWCVARRVFRGHVRPQLVKILDAVHMPHLGPEWR